MENVESPDEKSLQSQQPKRAAGFDQLILEHFFQRGRWRQFLFWFVAILILKHTSLWNPPVWDSAMGVFPPAIYLYNHSFDVWSLGQQDNWWQGGPNVHTFCLLSWMIAIVMTITGSTSATFLIMHLSMFAGFAWAMTLFSRLLHRWGVGHKTAMLAAAFVLLMPLVLVQVGRIYMEVPVLILSITAVDLWSRGKQQSAALVCGVALFFKLTGMALALAMLAVLFLGIRKFDLRKARVALLVFGVIALRMMISMAFGASGGEAGDWGTNEQLFRSLLHRLKQVPDLSVVLGLGSICCAILLVPRVIAMLRGVTIDEEDEDESLQESRLLALIFPLVFIAGTIAMILMGSLPLHRYLIPAIPFSLVAILFLLQRINLPQGGTFVLCIACVWCALNRDGRFYPQENLRFSVLERSDESDLMHDSQVGGIEKLKKKPDDIAAFVSREVYYMVSDPMMGYVDEEIPGVFPVFATPFDSMPLDKYPDEFYFLITNRKHGGSRMLDLLKEIRADERYEVVKSSYQNKRFGSTLFHVRKN